MYYTVAALLSMSITEYERLKIQRLYVKMYHCEDMVI